MLKIRKRRILSRRVSFFNLHISTSLHHHIFPSRSIAFTTFALSAKAEKRKYPSPEGPKPDPGVPTTFASLSKMSKNSQELSPFLVLTQTYGALIPPKTV